MPNTESVFKHKNLSAEDKVIEMENDSIITQVGILYTGNINKTHKFTIESYENSNINSADIYNNPFFVQITFLGNQQEPENVYLGKTGILELHNVAIKRIEFQGNNNIVEWDKIFIEYLQTKI